MPLGEFIDEPNKGPVRRAKEFEAPSPWSHGLAREGAMEREALHFYLYAIMKIKLIKRAYDRSIPYP